MSKLPSIFTALLVLNLISTIQLYPSTILSNVDRDIELNTEDQNYIESLLATELHETETNVEDIGIRGPVGPCIPLPAEFPINIGISTLGSVAFGQTYSYDIRFRSPLRNLEAGELVLIHTLPFDVTLLSLNENQPQTRRIICNHTSFSVCFRRDSTRGRYKICLINNQAVNLGEEIILRIVVRAPNRSFTIVSKTAIQARTQSGRYRNIETPVLTIKTHVGTNSGMPISKTDTTMIEALSS